MDKADTTEMQTIVQVNIYRLNHDTPEFLLVQPLGEGNKGWQPISEPVKDDGSIADAINAAINNQAGLQSFKRLSPEMYSYEWYSHGQQGRDIVFAAEVSIDTQVTIDNQRFSQYAWLPFSEAVNHLKWDGNKEALRRLRDRIVHEIATRPVQPPEPVQPPAPVVDTIEEPAPYAPTGLPTYPPTPQDAPPSPSVFGLPVYTGPDAPPPPPHQDIPGNQQAPDMDMPPQPESPRYPYQS